MKYPQLGFFVLLVMSLFSRQILLVHKGFHTTVFHQMGSQKGVTNQQYVMAWEYTERYG